MTALYTTVQLREIEQQHAGAGLMEKAGQAAAILIQDILPAAGSRILVLAGPGNNGGDAFVAARYLKASWFQVCVVFAGDAARLPPDAHVAYTEWLSCGGVIAAAIPDGQWDMVVDGLFGIGLTRQIAEPYAGLIRQINALDVPILSLDVPSGLSADTGRVDEVVVHADVTLTYLGLKPGLFMLDGPDYAGEVHVSDLGVPVGDSPLALLDAVPALPGRRLKNSHKGTHGSVGVIGGTDHMVGAALLAARAAMLLGAGRVYCGALAQQAVPVDILHAELMMRPAETIPALSVSALVVGPGMGQGSDALALLKASLSSPCALIIDADALHLLATHQALQAMLTQRDSALTVMTPHPGEAAVMLECSTAEVQADRLAAAQKITHRYHAITVLKGCGTVIAFPVGHSVINATGNPGLASAGMGDTLSGMIAAFAAQGMELADAAILAVYLHGAAADTLVKKGIGPIGLTASEVAMEARALLNQWVYA